MHRLTTLIVWSILSAVMLAGCSPFGTKRDAEPAAEYLLDWRAAEARETSHGGPVIQISPLRAEAGFRSANMVYVAQPHRLQRFARHRWVAPPARMLEPLLVRAAEASGLYAAVGSPGAPINADLRLDGELQHLQLLVEGDRHRLQLALRVSLISVADGRLLAGSTFDLEEISEPSPYGGVEAANRAVARLMDELTEFLRRHAGS